MKVINRLPVLATLIASLSFSMVVGRPSHAESPRKYALLVAVSSYQHAEVSELRFPQRDATETGKLLNANGYTVRYLLGEQATRDGIEKELKAVTEQGDRGGVALLGFFGHGVQYGDKDYFVPFDARLRVVTDADENQLRDNNGRLKREPDPDSLVPMQSMLDALDVCGAGNRLILADCCRNDPSRAKGFRGRTFGADFTGSRLPSNTAVIFACGNGEQAFENDTWGHGAFTKALLDECAVASHVTANELSVALNRRVNQLLGDSGIDSKQTVSMKFNGGVIELQLNVDRPAKMSDLPNEFKTDGGIRMRRVSPKQWWAETEITRGQWSVIMQTSPWNQDAVRVADDLPATRITWQKAKQFCKELTSRERAAGKIPPNSEYRLPTVGQWVEIAKTHSADLTLTAWTSESSGRKLQPTGRKSPGRDGLYDVHGNVWEWCDSTERDKPAVGGSFLYPMSIAKTDESIYYESNEAFRDIGFRPILVSRQ